MNPSSADGGVVLGGLEDVVLGVVWELVKGVYAEYRRTKSRVCAVLTGHRRKRFTRYVSWSNFRLECAVCGKVVAEMGKK